MMKLPKYVLVSAKQLLVAIDHGNPTVPGGMYMPILMAGGNVRIVGVSHDVRGKEFTISASVWPVAVADWRIADAAAGGQHAQKSVE